MNERTEPEYHSVEEAREAVDEMTQHAWKKLEASATFRVSGNFRTSGPDLLQEALTRLLNGNRRWSKDSSIERCLLGAMKSIAFDWNRDVQQQRKLRDPRHVSEIPDLAVRPQGSDTEARDVAAIAAVEDCCAANENAASVLESRLEGEDPATTCETWDLSRTEYDSAVKYIRRCVTKMGKRFHEH